MLFAHIEHGATWVSFLAIGPEANCHYTGQRIQYETASMVIFLYPCIFTPRLGMLHGKKSWLLRDLTSAQNSTLDNPVRERDKGLVTGEAETRAAWVFACFSSRSFSVFRSTLQLSTTKINTKVDGFKSTIHKLLDN